MDEFVSKRNEMVLTIFEMFCSSFPCLTTKETAFEFFQSQRVDFGSVDRKNYV